jgi:hypothetical protein
MMRTNDERGDRENGHALRTVIAPSSNQHERMGGKWLRQG